MPTRPAAAHCRTVTAETLPSFPITCAPAFDGPDLTPRTALLLAVAGRRLAGDARAASPMYRFAAVLDGLAESLERGLRPVPVSLADQLCLHVMIACATDLAFEVGDGLGGDLPYSDFDYDFELLYETLLPSDEHEDVILTVQESPRGAGCFDFATLCEVLPDDVLNRLFRPRF